MDARGARDALVSEAGLTAAQADAFVCIASGGPMDAARLAAGMGVAEGEAAAAAASLAGLGGLIEMPGGRFEAMHPRFAAVNMYRRALQRRGEAPGRNDRIDAAGAALEGPYEDARAK